MKVQVSVGQSARAGGRGVGGGAGGVGVAAGGAVARPAGQALAAVVADRVVPGAAGGAGADVGAAEARIFEEIAVRECCLLQQNQPFEK